MSHRTQITLTDKQYDILVKDSKENGLSIAELIRRAVDGSYSQQTSLQEQLQVVEQTAGLWADREQIKRDLQELRKPLGPTPA